MDGVLAELCMDKTSVEAIDFARAEALLEEKVVPYLGAKGLGTG
jgi:hypothetical protein